MSLRRGDLVTVAAKGPYTAKPRPALVVQASETLPYRDSDTVCLLTADLIYRLAGSTLPISSGSRWRCVSG